MTIRPPIEFYLGVTFTVIAAIVCGNFANSIPHSGNNPCLKGPSYWCADSANARRCGIKSDVCAKHNEFTGKIKKSNCKQQQQINPPIGSNPCTWGPSYWCASVANAEQCGRKEEDCKQYGGIKNVEAPPPTVKNETVPVLVGSNPCTWGPSYWCASLENAQKCGLTEADCAKYGGINNATATSTP